MGERQREREVLSTTTFIDREMDKQTVKQTEKIRDRERKKEREREKERERDVNCLTRGIGKHK